MKLNVMRKVESLGGTGVEDTSIFGTLVPHYGRKPHLVRRKDCRQDR